METLLEQEQIQILRSQGLVSDNEVAILEGDLIVAKNVLNGEKRLLGKVSEVLSGSNKRILKG